MADLRLADHSLEAISAAVLSEGLVPPKQRWRFKGPGRKSGVERLLKDPFYRGDFVWDGTLYTDDPRPHFRDLAVHVVKRVQHEPVWTRDEFDAIQATFGRRAPQENRKHEGLFCGPGFRLRCAQCECMVCYSPKWKGAASMMKVLLASATAFDISEELALRSWPWRNARSLEERRDFLAKLLCNPVLDERSVRYDLKKPFRILAEMRETEDWRGGRDSNPRPPA